MSEKKYTLAQVAALKGATVEELCDYLNSNEISISSMNADYTLTDSEINSIKTKDQNLAFKLRYSFASNTTKQDVDEDNNAPSSSANVFKTRSEQKASEKPKVNVSDKIDLDGIIGKTSAKTLQQQKEPKKAKREKRLIGIIKFFDSSKGFGFIVANAKGLSTKPEDTGKLYDFYVCSGNFKSHYSASDGDWVIFKPKKNYRKQNEAGDVEKLEATKDVLIASMKYRGLYGKIKGTDSHSSKTYNENILCHIIKQIQLSEQGKAAKIIIDAFCEYLSKQPLNQRQETIGQFLSDKKLKKVLANIVFSENYASDDPARIESFQLLKYSITNALFSTEDRDSLEALPDGFDYSLKLQEVLAILLNAASNDKSLVTHWLEKHAEDFIPQIQLPNDKADVIPLRLILYKVTHDGKWITDISLQWDDMREYISKDNDKDDALSFILVFFEDRDAEFVKKHQIVDILPNEVRDALDDTFSTQEEKPAHALVPQLVDFYADKDLAKICQYISNGIKDINSFLGKLRSLVNKEIKNNTKGVRDFLTICRKTGLNINDLFPEDISFCDELLMELFVDTGNFEYLNNIEDFDSCPKWIAIQPKEFILSFIQQYGSLVEDSKDDDTFLSSIGGEAIASALSTVSVDQQYKLLRFFPEKFVIRFVFDHFSNSELFDIIARERWAKAKDSVPYVAFDLESDGDDIKEFAFLTEGHTNKYEDIGQIDSLIRVLKEKQIIVGHNIKKWDLTILKSRGYETTAFVWDTLVIEILLNPCRYAYSLHTSHNAKEDTELTDKLFWNQLFRLSQNEKLCNDLKDFLPNRINAIIESLQQPMFAEYFKRTGGTDTTFFHEIDDIDEDLIKELESIETDTGDDSVLIIAPQRLWSKIAQYVTVSFLNNVDSIDYLSISRNKLQERPLSDSLKQAMLLRFTDYCHTPIVANLAQYLRINVFKDSVLQDYVDDNTRRIQCSDLRIISDDNLSDYKFIYLIGCELENRLNQYTLPTLLSPSDFWKEQSSIPMRFGGSSFVEITKEERVASNLFADVPKDAANVWLERQHDDKYAVNYNFNIVKRLKALKDSTNKYANIKEIPWQSKEAKNDSVYLVHTKRDSKFDVVQKRVASTSRYRSIYWIYQMALLTDVNSRSCNLPLIYILDDDLELDQVASYARSRGFYVPQEGSLDRKLELISQHRRGMVIVPKGLFFTIVDKRLDNAYCYVWDQMAVEKHAMMWRDIFSEASLLDDNLEEKGKELNKGRSRDTYQSVLLSLWPEYEYYNKFVREKNALSRMYILDPFLEDYYQLSKTWGTSIFVSSGLWNSEKSFNESMVEAEKVFHDDQTEEAPKKDNDVSRAMDVILATLITQNGSGNKPEWSDIQKEVLPKILSKKENYLVAIPTGGGKSVLFQGPALYNASYTNRLSLVVTPLKALMQDQVKELAEKGFYTNVDFLNGDRTYQETRSIYRKINSGELAMLYVTPERFRSRAFLNALETRMTHDHGLEYMIFDEAHCISQWGMEFRPEYLNVIKKCKEFSERYKGGFCMAMFSATVTDLIFQQINEQVPIVRLGEKDGYNPVREHIGMSFLQVNNDITSRIAAIEEYIKSNSINFQVSRMIVFCKTRRQCEELSAALADDLAQDGLLDADSAQERVGFFHAGIEAEDREETYNRFKSKEDPIYILCATKAFGMGMDIPNIHYIVHLMPPNVLEDYLQEVGRAGRNKAQYQEVGFNTENPIPTVCLFSKEDIRKSREQLLQSQLSWINLEEIRKAVNDYIERIQPLDMTRQYPIVIPNDLWRNNLLEHDYTNFKLGEYWLERLGRIRMGFLAPAHITVSLHDKETGNVPTINQRWDKDIQNLMLLLQGNANQHGSNTIQVSVQTLASSLSMHSTKLIDLLIKCSRLGLLTIEQEVHCRIANTRSDEVPYLLKYDTTNLALQIIIDGVVSLLDDNKINKEKSYATDEIKQYLEVSNLDDLLVPVEKKRKNGTVEVVKYMPWYNSEDKNLNKGLSVASHYKKDLYVKRLRQVFTLLDIIPDIKCRSYIDREKREVRQSVLIEKKTWRTFIPKFKQDCIKVLNYVYNLQKENKTTLNWAEAINRLGLHNNSYDYFSDTLRFLKGMAYIVCDNLLPTGVEVYTTERSKEPIKENIKQDSPDHQCQRNFNEAIQIRNLRLCVMDALTQKVKTRKDFQDLVSAYFSKTDASGFMELLGKYYPDNDPIWDAIRETAIADAEEKMRGNVEQWAIYNEDPNTNVNVEAGPGSGKTHVLTMKCAKLIYRQHVLPSRILVLAYNRAVVVELKTRLAKLFASLGLSQSASQLNVYTFHALAKRVCGSILENIDLHEWEKVFLDTLRQNPMDMTKVFPDIQYVLVDEFQDITQTRLDALFTLKEIYPQVSFFTIGDKDQSIYGFEKEESMNPNFYYDQLYKKLSPKRMTMSTNYRSYPNILKVAAKLLPKGSTIPIPCKKNVQDEPQDQYVFVNKNSTNWYSTFETTITTLKNRGINDVAVFFRTNNEVYHGYALIRAMNLSGIRLRIQGASVCELYRKREIYTVIRYLEEKKDRPLEFDYDRMHIKDIISRKIRNSENWDRFYLDFAYTMVLDYIAYAQSDEVSHTYGDMAQFIKDSLSEDNPQLYKLYDKYKDERILQDNQMNVVLTTMHKVKGLEFDAVIITPSVASLPFVPGQEAVDVNIPLTEHEKESIEEEQRLLYVAFTRARKYLVAYLGEREHSVLEMRKYSGDDSSLGIREKEPGLDNYNIGFNANYNFLANRDIVNKVTKNAPVVISRFDRTRKDGNPFQVYNIICNDGTIVGQLSRNSMIRYAMEQGGLYSLAGFFVSDVFYWTYEDSVKADERNLRNNHITNFASGWSEKAREQGYVFIVDIAGYGN